MKTTKWVFDNVADAEATAKKAGRDRGIYEWKDERGKMWFIVAVNLGFARNYLAESLGLTPELRGVVRPGEPMAEQVAKMTEAEKVTLRKLLAKG